MSLIRPSPPQRYVFWQPIPSMHQLPFLDALADRSDVEVVCAYAEPITEDRLRLGWGGTETCRVALVAPDARQAEAMIRNAGPETLNVVSGMHCHPSVVRWFRHAITSDAPLALISESYDPRGVKGMIRRIRSAVDAVRYRDRIRLLFAMGAIGERWFKTAGFPTDRIHPFAYVTPVPGAWQAAARSNPAVRILYVGQLIPRKGIDVLLGALAADRGAKWSLTIVGSGPEESALRELAAEGEIADRISWITSVPNAEIPATMAGHDVLVLPSRYDGWGAVVNEALSVGTPVICSDMCGASDLIRSPAMGGITKAGSVASLAAALSARVALGPVRDDERRRIAETAASFSPAVVADYFHDVLHSCFAGGLPPTPPWRTAS